MVASSTISLDSFLMSDLHDTNEFQCYDITMDPLDPSRFYVASDGGMVLHGSTQADHRPSPRMFKPEIGKKVGYWEFLFNFVVFQKPLQVFQVLHFVHMMNPSCYLALKMEVSDSTAPTMTDLWLPGLELWTMNLLSRLFGQHPDLVSSLSLTQQTGRGKWWEMGYLSQ